MKSIIQRCRLLFCSVVLIPLASALVTPLYGWSQDEKVFAEVPEQYRVSLIERINLLFEYGRTQQWGKRYDLFCKDEEDVSREEYIERNIQYAKKNKDMDLEFTPKLATLLHSGDQLWYINGCIRQLQDGKIVEYIGNVQARLINGEWCITEFGVTIPIDGELIPCKPKKKKSK